MKILTKYHIRFYQSVKHIKCLWSGTKLCDLGKEMLFHAIQRQFAKSYLSSQAEVFIFWIHSQGINEPVS